MTHLTRMDLINWADSKLAEGQLPQLIHRLIMASNQAVETIVMPYGDSVGRSGLDGYVRAICASSYVPEGESVWECGRNKRHVQKANDDFKNRTTGTAHFRQRETRKHPGAYRICNMARDDSSAGFRDDFDADFVGDLRILGRCLFSHPCNPGGIRNEKTNVALYGQFHTPGSRWAMTPMNLPSSSRRAWKPLSEPMR